MSFDWSASEAMVPPIQERNWGGTEPKGRDEPSEMELLFKRQCGYKVRIFYQMFYDGTCMTFKLRKPTFGRQYLSIDFEVVIVTLDGGVNWSSSELSP